MSRKQKLLVLVVISLALLSLAGWRLSNSHLAVLQPQGTISRQEKNLMLSAAAMSLIVVVPVYIMLFWFSWKYRENNTKARYEPSFETSRKLESIWWGVPILLILILGVITWRSSHQLDPFRRLNSTVPPLTIQVIALQWKWLFIYPGQNVAAVNFVQLPVNTPVKFEITSDAPMNSFWIPQLGGQIYAMSGMATNLNLEASRAGDYQGVSANISGDGFAGMHFVARATSESDFNRWLQKLKQSPGALTTESYTQLAKPSSNNPVGYFSTTQSGLFDSVVAKYLSPIYFNPARAGQ